MIFDTHAHYDDEAFDADREALLASLPEAGIGAVVNIGASMESTERSLALAARYPFIYAAAGVHPSECGDMKEADIERLKEAAAGEKTVAIGEIGLDYYWDEPDRKIQKKWFDRQLSLAAEVGLPVIIHSRDAAQDTLEMMKAAHAGEIGGVIHCFSYGKEMAREYLNMGFFLGIGGVGTFQNGRKLKEVVEYAPLSSIVLETDCPYLSPVPLRGKRNSSRNLPYVADMICQLKGIDRETLERVTWQNALRLYRLPQNTENAALKY